MESELPLAQGIVFGSWQVFLVDSPSAS